MSLVQCSAPNNLVMETLIYTYFATLLYLCALQRTEQVYLNYFSALSPLTHLFKREIPPMCEVETNKIL